MAKVMLFIATLAGLALSGCASVSPLSETPALDQTPLLTGQGIAIGSTPIPFGTPAAAAEETLRRYWGEPDRASDWGPSRTEWGFCGGSLLRVLSWGDVHVLMSNVSGGQEVTGWRWDGPLGPPAIGVARNLSPQAPVVRVGETVAQAQVAYPSAYALAAPLEGEYAFFIPHMRMVRDTPLLESGVSGVVANPGPEGTILLLEAGSLCDT